MVNLVTLIPSDNSFENLTQLKGKLRVLQPRGYIGGAISLLLTTVNNFVLRLSVDYRDVVFKFECFGLEVELASENLCSNADEIIRIEEWQYIKCLFRFEWQRPALAGEVPMPLS